MLRPLSARYLHARAQLLGGDSRGSAPEFGKLLDDERQLRAAIRAFHPCHELPPQTCLLRQYCFAMLLAGEFRELLDELEASTTP